MRKHSDIKWSEYVRRAIKERLDLNVVKLGAFILITPSFG